MLILGILSLTRPCTQSLNIWEKASCFCVLCFSALKVDICHMQSQLGWFENRERDKYMTVVAKSSS